MEKKENIKAEIHRMTASILASIILGQSVFAYHTIIPAIPYKQFVSGSVQTSQTGTVKSASSKSLSYINRKEKYYNAVKSYNLVTIPAEETGGVIGLYAGKLLDNPADNLFHFNIKEKISAEDRVKLVYELQGISDSQGVAISINDGFANGGTWVQKSDDWSRQEYYLNAGSLNQGENTVQFSLPENAAYGYQVRKLELVIEKSKAATLRFDNLKGVSYKGEGYVSGFVQGLTAESQLRIAGKTVTHYNGFFETVLPSVKTVEVTVTTKGEILKQTVVLEPISHVYQETLLPVFTGQSQTFVKGQSMNLSVGAASLEVNASALLENKTLSITPLRAIDLPALDPTMTNLTTGNGYRFLPHGEHFAEGAVVKLGYNKELLPPGYTEEDIRTFFYDKNTGHWEALERDSLDIAHQIIISKTTHFTDMINGVIKTPESPDTQGFAATMMTDIKAADPTAAIQTIQPPAANQQGSANLSYHIEVPPGRRGMQPNINITYNSDGGSGWLGEGWDIPLSKITVDTRWGVPRYSKTEETETYSLDGEMLVLMEDNKPTVAHRGDKVSRQKRWVQFYTRKEGNFAKILRYGDYPSEYRWVVYDKNGTQYEYWSILRNDGKIAEWGLNNVRDVNGNYFQYDYLSIDETVGNLHTEEMYVSRIEYGSSDYGPFSSIEFESEGMKTVKTNNGRYGFLTTDSRLLTKINVKHLDKTVRSYDFVYKKEDGAFKKTLLEKIVQNDASGAKFNEHVFDYYDDVKATEGYVPFSSTKEDWNTGNDNVTGNAVITKADISKDGVIFNDKISALGGGVSTSGGFSLYVGVGPNDTQLNSTSNTGGASFSYSPSESKGLLALVDINGDGLPDKVFKESAQIYYRPNLGNGAFGDRYEINGISAISMTNSTATSYGISVKVGFGNVVITEGTSLENAKTTNSTYFQDVNNDGLVDLIRDGVVYFNHIVNLNGNAIPTFTTSSSDTATHISRR